MASSPERNRPGIPVSVEALRRNGTRYAAIAAGLVAVGMLAFALLDGFSGLSAFAGVLALLAVASLALTVRGMVRSDFGGAIAWGYCGLPLVIVLLLLSLHFVHLLVTLGLQTCDPFAGTCDTPTAASWLPLVLWVWSTLFTVAALRTGKLARDQSGTV